MKSNKKPNIQKFEVDVSKIKPNCILCGKKITDEEFNFEAAKTKWILNLT